MFADWCRQNGQEPLPASPETVAGFLTWQAQAGAKMSTIAQRSAAIRNAHCLLGLEPPTAAESVRAVMRGIRRTIDATPDRKTPATADLIMRMIAVCPDTLTGLRDHALLALGFAGAFRRSELVAIEVEDLMKVRAGLRIVIRRNSQQIAIPRGYRLRPVEAVQVWLAAAKIRGGPIFRPITKSGWVQPFALTDRSVANIVKAYAESAGLDPAAFAGHSLRSGFLTSAAENGASIFKMMEVSRHKSMDTLCGYVRRADRKHAGAALFHEHAGGGFL